MRGNSVLNEAEDAREKNKIGEIKDRIAMEILDYSTEKMTKPGTTIDRLWERLAAAEIIEDTTSPSVEGPETEGENNKYTITIKEGYKVEIIEKADGTVTIGGITKGDIAVTNPTTSPSASPSTQPSTTPSTTPEVGPNGKPLVGTITTPNDTEHTEAEDKNGKPITIPAGYTVVQNGTGNVEYKTDNENHSPCVEDGIVIEDENHNQFVWVPVPDVIWEDETKTIGSGYTPMAKLQEGSTENYMGMLYDFMGTTATYNASYKPGTTTYREPDVVTKYDGNSDYLTQAGITSDLTGDGNKNADDLKKQLQEEFNSMVASVKRYGGFYIGRYETSGLSNSDTTVKPTVQKGKTTINNTTWYRMYKESKNIKANEKVTSSMIWGCQWDAKLRWFQTSTDEKVKNFPTNSANYGNYKDNSIDYIKEDGSPAKTTVNREEIIPTGSAEITKINNIYDMAGNIWDWTIEAWSIDIRVFRRREFLLFWS